MTGHVTVEESADAGKFVDGRRAQFPRAFQFTLKTHLFEIAQRGNEPPHPARGAGSCAAVRNPPYFRSVARLHRRFELIELAGGLLDIKRYQFAQILGISVGEIQQPVHINRWFLGHGFNWRFGWRGFWLGRSNSGPPTAE